MNAKLEMNVYVNADYGGDKETRRSMSSSMVMMFDNLIMQYARRQIVIATLSCEVESYALASGLAEA